MAGGGGGGRPARPRTQVSPVAMTTEPGSKASQVTKQHPQEAHQPIVPPAAVAPPVPLDQRGSILQLQEVGPETAA